MQKRCFLLETEDENLFAVVTLDSIRGRFARSSITYEHHLSLAVITGSRDRNSDNLQL